jgi:hypothetical protein
VSPSRDMKWKCIEEMRLTNYHTSSTRDSGSFMVEMIEHEFISQKSRRLSFGEPLTQSGIRVS